MSNIQVFDQRGIKRTFIFPVSVSEKHRIKVGAKVESGKLYFAGMIIDENGKCLNYSDSDGNRIYGNSYMPDLSDPAFPETWDPVLGPPEYQTMAMFPTDDGKYIVRFTTKERTNDRTQIFVGVTDENGYERIFMTVSGKTYPYIATNFTKSHTPVDIKI